MADINQPTTIRPAPPPPNNIKHKQIIIHNIPTTASTRRVRKKIGRATYYLQSNPPIRFLVRAVHVDGRIIGRLTFTSAEYVEWFLDVYGRRNTRYPITVEGVQLRFSRAEEPVDRFFLRAIQNRENQDEVDSDYDEEGDFRDHDVQSVPTVACSRVDCGAFDEAGEFCVGWSRSALTPHTYVSFDIDEARLRIRVEKIVIQASIYDIGGIFYDEKARNVYFVFKQAPIFLRDVPPADAEPAAWIEDEAFDHMRPFDRYERVSHYDLDHARCACHSLIYRAHFSNFSVVDGFFRHTKGRLRIDARIKNVTDASKESSKHAFDMPLLNERLKHLDYSVAFQVQALLHPLKILPGDLLDLTAHFSNVQQRLGARDAATAVRTLKGNLHERGPVSVARQAARFSMKAIVDYLTNCKPEGAGLGLKQNGILIHTAYITPSSTLRVEGPHHDEGNRILRMYPDQLDNFLRVRFTDEDGSQIRVALQHGNLDAEGVIQSTIGDTLRNGITVGGRNFQFLAYSQSGLREHSVYFMRPFKDDKGNRVKPESVRASIGDLSDIRSPAKYAARMGQALSTTAIAITIPRSVIREEEDISTTDGKYEFTDGVGLMSTSIMSRIHEKLMERNVFGHLPTAVQIRLAGAKGMLNLDPRLEGDVVVLRKSMVKFPLGPKETFSIDIANIWTVPMPVVTNRQMIALLESLGTDKQAFIKLQGEAIDILEANTRTSQSALHLFASYGVKHNSLPSTVVQKLMQIGLEPVRDIAFLREANLSLAHYALRTLKYRTRVKIPNSYTLPGIADYTNKLEPNQIAIVIAEPGKEPRFLTGRCIIGRSPMLAPGDVQFAQAVEPKGKNALKVQKNVVIFSVKGERPLPSQLGGGDLDGDLYNVIMDPEFFPKYTSPPSDYAAVPPCTLDRPCQMTDVIDFFIDFVKHEKVGIIATRHLLLSDQAREGSLDIACVQLAQLHSCAVDYPKSGRAPRVQEMPRCPAQKPDYMQKEFRLESVPHNKDVLPAHMHPRCKDLYYPSKKALGHMFRAIDVRKKFLEWQEQTAQAERLPHWQTTLKEILLRSGRPQPSKTMIRAAERDVRNYYRKMEVLAHEHGSHNMRLTEQEVFMGHVICRSPLGTRMSPFDVVQRLQDDFADLCLELQTKVLLDGGSAAIDSQMKVLLWKWLEANVLGEVSASDITQLAETGVGNVDTNLEAATHFLNTTLQRGLAFFCAAIEHRDDDKGGATGRSAPFVVVPAIVKGHAVLDAIEEYHRRKRQDCREENDAQALLSDRSPSYSPMSVSTPMTTAPATPMSTSADSTLVVREQEQASM